MAAKENKKKSAKKNGTPKVEFKFEKDTKRKHRFNFGEYEDSISGTFYLNKGDKIPDKIILVKADD